MDNDLQQYADEIKKQMDDLLAQVQAKATETESNFVDTRRTVSAKGESYVNDIDSANNSTLSYGSTTKQNMDVEFNKVREFAQQTIEDIKVSPYDFEKYIKQSKAHIDQLVVDATNASTGKVDEINKIPADFQEYYTNAKSGIETSLTEVNQHLQEVQNLGTSVEQDVTEYMNLVKNNQVYSKTQTDNLLKDKANTADVDTKLAKKRDTATKITINDLDDSTKSKIENGSDNVAKSNEVVKLRGAQVIYDQKDFNIIPTVNGETLVTSTGNVASSTTATKLAKAVKINNVDFDGSKDITLKAGDVGAYTKEESNTKFGIGSYREQRSGLGYGLYGTFRRVGNICSVECRMNQTVSRPNGSSTLNEKVPNGFKPKGTVFIHAMVNVGPTIRNDCYLTMVLNPNGTIEAYSLGMNSQPLTVNLYASWITADA